MSSPGAYIDTSFNLSSTNMSQGDNFPETPPSHSVTDKHGPPALLKTVDVMMPIAESMGPPPDLPAVHAALSMVVAIFSVVEKITYNKKQTRRLALSARDTVEAIKDIVSAADPRESDLPLAANINKLVK